MSASINIALVIGSLRKESINRKFAEYIVSQMPDSVTIKEVHIADLPLYNQDYDDRKEPVVRQHPVAGHRDLPAQRPAGDGDRLSGHGKARQRRVDVGHPADPFVEPCGAREVIEAEPTRPPRRGRRGIDRDSLEVELVFQPDQEVVGAEVGMRPARRQRLAKPAFGMAHRLCQRLAENRQVIKLEHHPSDVIASHHDSRGRGARNAENGPFAARQHGQGRLMVVNRACRR